ncbi:MAG: hypothetical protein HY902_19465 [Deltaproteobacteria bacterium]|nr:hypothetical protein [Deltaproteobacteria bacterium]
MKTKIKWTLMGALWASLLLAACGNEPTGNAGSANFVGNGADTGLGNDLGTAEDATPTDDAAGGDDALVGTDDSASGSDTAGGDDSGEDTAGGDTATPDDTSAGPDTAPADTGEADASAPDTAAPDTAAPDTAAPDTAAPDVAVPDTTAPDTAAPDTTAPDTAAPDAGVLCGGVSCDDGNPCTVDSCSAGQCSWSTQAGLLCDDGNACTQGDACQGLKCVGGTGKPNCDDKNPCTADACDSKAGCVHTPAGSTCDDGNPCTTGDACKDGKCAGPTGTCDDGKPCTTDSCDKVTGNCSWVAASGPCDDGNPCTVGEACASGNCGGGSSKNCDDKDPCSIDACDPKSGCVYSVNAANPPCDDGSKCTSGDACVQGKCTGVATNCDDGNLCTTDGCDPATGNCSLLANTLPCSVADKCVTAKCGNGKCVASTAVKSCDDKNPCTADSCEAVTGACVHKAANDGAACDDGIACTAASQCAGGGCKPTKACQVFANAFDCNVATPFAFAVPEPTPPNPPRAVKWLVDDTPKVAALAGLGCSLNINDGTDFCDLISQKDGVNQCQLPLGTATSPVLDFTATGGLLPTITFDTYYDVDVGSPENDTPKLRVLDAATGQELAAMMLPKGPGDIKVLKTGYTITLPQAIGKKVKVELSLNVSVSTPFDQGNSGAGWFVDNFSVTAAPGTAEVCGNGLDDDFDGAADCADSQCAKQASCIENCGDGIDNDVDSLTDCADSDCSGNYACATPIQSWNFDQCNSLGWTISATVGNGVAWAVDATPNIGPMPYGACALNFNNGTNYCTAAQCPDSMPVPAGTATLATTFSLPAGKKITLALWTYLDVEDPNQQNGANFDNTYVELSTGAEFNNPLSFKLARDVTKAWNQQSFDASSMAGKTVYLRVRFNAGDGKYNNTAGPFVDDIRLFAL